MTEETKAKRQAYRRAWAAANPDKVKEAKAKWNKEHPEKARERSKAYYQLHKHKMLEIAKAWAKVNPEKCKEYSKTYRDSTKEEKLAYVQAWRMANPGKVAQYCTNRRAAQEGADGQFTSEEFTALKNFYGNICLACKKPAKLTADHVMPLSKGGSNSIDNIQPLCGPCNSSKGTKSTDYR